jgi:hypothetical protein
MIRIPVQSMMIGVAILALGFVWLRFSLDVLPWSATHDELMPNGTRVQKTSVPEAVVLLIAYGLPLLAFVTLVMLGWRMLPPKPRFRQLRRRPGFLLGGVIVGCFVAVPAPAVFDRLPSASLRQAIHCYCLAFNGHCGWALLGGCFALAYLGRTRPHRSRLDRLALVLACFWLVVFMTWQITWLAAVTR